VYNGFVDFNGILLHISVMESHYQAHVYYDLFLDYCVHVSVPRIIPLFELDLACDKRKLPYLLSPSLPRHDSRIVLGTQTTTTRKSDVLAVIVILLHASIQNAIQ
jgi:hypothetical protein